MEDGDRNQSLAVADIVLPSWGGSLGEKGGVVGGELLAGPVSGRLDEARARERRKC